MKKIIFVFMAIMFATASGFAQESGAVIASEQTTHDFGQFAEKDGEVSHTFIVTNAGNSPLVINRVIASCGCTSPQWTSEPIAPGDKGEITITYDPEGRPGTFNKSISVYSNGKRGSFILSIKGEVL